MGKVDKLAEARALIKKLGDMPQEDVQKLITEQVGEALSAFMLLYSESLLKKDPQRYVYNASSLMLMGYLIRQNEEALALTNWGGTGAQA